MFGKKKGIALLVAAGLVGDVLLAGSIPPDQRGGESAAEAAVLSAAGLREASAVEIDNERAHRAYLGELKENNIYASYYAFYDIDGDGMDELLLRGGYLAMQLYTWKNGKVIYLLHEKYGGNMRLYPEQGMIEIPDGGHMDHYYGQFFKLRGTKCKRVAMKSWVVHYLNRSGTKTRITYQYRLSGKRVSKKKYQRYIKKLKQTTVVKRKQLQWNKVSVLRGK